MKSLSKYIFTLGLLLMAAACSEDGAATGEERDAKVEISGVDHEEWIYISLTTGQVVGKSAFGSVEGDEAWKNRTDWDMALCGEYVRTNSGTSGIGEGGLLKVDGMSYESIIAPVDKDFAVDEEQE